MITRPNISNYQEANTSIGLQGLNEIALYNNITGVPINNSTIGGTALWNGQKITSAYIGELTADNIGAGIITAGKIASGTISGNNIGAGEITADKLAVNSLSAISADLGTVNAGTINGVTIRGSYFESYGTNGVDIAFKSGVGGTLYGQIGYASLYNSLYFHANGKNLLLSSTENVVIEGDVLYTPGINVADNWIDDVHGINFLTSANNTTGGDFWYYFAGGTNYYFRSRNGTWNGQFDQTGF